MNGKIYLDSTEQLAELLKQLTGTTAIFEVHSNGEDRWILEFTGGY